MTDRLIMSPDDVHGFELLAAVEALRPDAAPLAAALVRAECIAVPWAAYAPLLALLDGLGHMDTTAGSEAAQSAMVAAWRGAQARVPGGPVSAPAAWDALAAMDLVGQAQAAIMFALHVTSAGLLRAQSDDAVALLQH
jgi:hypothetical protein